MPSVRREGELALDPAARLAEFQAFQRKYAAAFEQLKATLLHLDGSRVFNLLEECRLQHGRFVRERAGLTFHHWRDGNDAVPDAATCCLFTLLPHHLTVEERLALLKSLRQEVLAHLPRERIALSITHGGDLSAVAGRVTRLMRRVAGMDLPADFLAVQCWLTQEDMWALHGIVQETEHFIAAHRLADLMVQLTTLSRLSLLATAPTAIRVTARLDVPTATVAIRFHPIFWREQERRAGQDLLVRLQELALHPENGWAGPHWERVYGALSAADRAEIRALAAIEGLRLEALLRELHLKTRAAQADIQATIATAERLRAREVRGKITSEHSGVSSASRIEIRTVTGLGDRIDACREWLGRLQHRPYGQ